MSSDPNALLARLPPAEQAVARLAISRGYVSQTALVQGLARMPPGGSILPLLGSLSLAPQQLDELRRAYEQALATQSGLHNTVAAGSGTGSVHIAPGGTPTTVGPYEIERELARGGMGVVYLARHPGLKRRVALKLLPAEAGSEEAERFQIEAEAAARLQHPNIVGIYDVGTANGRHYLAMELIEGESLKARLKDGPLDPAEAVTLTEKLARAVAYAHSRSILHRDIKPHNVLIDADGEPQLTDFGLAKDVSSQDRGLTVTGQAMGTPAYMPPEQADGALDLIDRRSDVYSLGATLYQLLTGEPPFKGETALNIIAKVLSKDATPPSQVRPGLDRDLDTIVLKCLEKEPDARYPTARALANDLKRHLSGESILARPVGLFERLGRKARKQRGLVLGVGLGLFVLTASVGGVYVFAQEGRLRAEREKADAEREKADAEREKADAERQRTEVVEQARQALELSNKLRKAEAELERAYGALALARYEESADRFSLAWETVRDLKGTPPEEADLLSAEELRGAAALGLREAEGRLRRVLFPDDGGKARGCALSHDGERLAVLGSAGDLTAWTVAGRAASKLLESTPDQEVQSAVYTRDGRLLIYAAAQLTSDGSLVRGQIVALDAQTGEQRWATSSAVGGKLVLSNDGSKLAAIGGHEGRAEVRAVADGSLIFRCEAKGRLVASYSSGARAGAFSPGGELLAVGYEDGTLTLWQITGEGKVSSPLHAHRGSVVTFVGFAPPNSLLSGAPALITAGTDGRLIGWRLGPNLGLFKEHVFLEVESVVCGALQQTDGISAVLAAGTSDGTVFVWSMTGRTVAQLYSFPAHGHSIVDCSFSSDGRALATAAGEEPAAFWDLTRNQHRVGNGPIAFAPNGHMAFVGLQWDGSLPQGQGRYRTLLGLADERGALLQQINLGYVRPWDMEFLDDDTLLMTIDREYTVLADPAEEADRVPQFRVERLDLSQRRAEWSEHQPVAFSLELSPDRRTVLTGSWQRKIRENQPLQLRDTQTGQLKRELRWHGNTVRRALFLPDGGMLTASEDGCLARWASQGDAPVWARDVVENVVIPVAEPRPWRDRTAQDAVGVTYATLSEDGSVIVTADRSGSIRFWNTTDGTARHTLRAPRVSRSPPMFCAYTSAETLAVAYRDGRLTLIDLRLGRVLRETNLRSKVEHVTLDPKRRTLAVATIEQTLHLWDVEVPELPDLEAVARRRATAFLAKRGR